jgi:hypothetical protein
MEAQQNVLGKDYPRLWETLDSPSIEEPKPFETLVQLAVLV